MTSTPSTSTSLPPQAFAEPPLLFLKKFLGHGRRVASFSPSSRALATAMCQSIDDTRPQVIVELGAGSGAVTAMACRRMHRSSKLIALEIDPEFAAMAQVRCPQALVMCADVMHVTEKLASLGVDRFDVLLNGLPTPSLPKHVNRAVFECLQKLGPQASFSQLTVMPLVYQRMYERLFEQVEFKLVMQNLPPGGVYHCKNLRRDFERNIPGK